MVSNLNLPSLAEGMPGLTPSCGNTLAEAAAVCLEIVEHKIGVSLELTGMGSGEFLVHWPSVTEQQRRCHNDRQEATERGASAVAILLLKEVTGKVVLNRSAKGPGLGFDYWIGDAASDDDENILPFVNQARLEISGILWGSRAQVDSRVRQKLAQIKPSDHLAPGYVAVVEFGRPLAVLRDK